MKYVFMLCLLPFIATAQFDESVKLQRISLETNVGLFNVSPMNATSNFVHCFECSVSKARQVPQPSLAWNAGVNIRLGHRNTVSLNYQYNQVRFENQFYEEAFGTPSIVSRLSLLIYSGFQVGHSLKLLSSECIEFSLSNGVQYDRFRKEDDSYYRYDLIKFGISYYGKVESAVLIGKSNAILLFPTFRIALTKYNEADSSNDKFLPFGYGLMIGWRSTII